MLGSGPNILIYYVFVCVFICWSVCLSFLSAIPRQKKKKNQADAGLPLVSGDLCKHWADHNRLMIIMHECCIYDAGNLHLCFWVIITADNEE